MSLSTRPSRLFGFCVLACCGCVRQDAEILTRVGRKLADGSNAATAGQRDKLPFRLTAAGAGASLADQIQQRFASDKVLFATRIDLEVRGAEVELKGPVETEAQKLRAFDLAETTHGVEKVVDSLQIRDKNAEK
jgi:osmotically-inducible protein OsmY